MNKLDILSSQLRDAVYDSIRTAPNVQSRVAQYIARKSELIGELSISELARRTNSGEASIVRFCRTLGFSGFREFKIAFAAEIERDKARRFVQHLTPEDTHISPELANLSAALQYSIAASARLLDDTQIQRLAERLRHSVRVEIFGVGVSAICASLFAQRLIWLGVPIHSTDSIGIARGLVRTLDTTSFAIGISYTGMSEETLDFLKSARAMGAHTLAITTRANSALAEIAQEVLLLSSDGPWPEPGSARLTPSMALLSECVAARLKKS